MSWSVDRPTFSKGLSMRKQIFNFGCTFELCGRLANCKRLEVGSADCQFQVRFHILGEHIVDQSHW